MLTFIVRHGAAAGLFALVLVASSHSPARADWTITGSCAGSWGMRNCVVNKRDFPRDTNVRQVRGYEGDAESKAIVERERRESLARDSKWLAFCKPVLLTDRYGVSRYNYARPGCEFGRSE